VKAPTSWFDGVLHAYCVGPFFAKGFVLEHFTIYQNSGRVCFLFAKIAVQMVKYLLLGLREGME
jgi:hypothetical protein